MRVALLGFGQIGGSIARALRVRRPRWALVAWSPSGGGPARAAGDGVIEHVAATATEAIREADLVVLAAPPLACLELIEMLSAAILEDGAVVTDVASTKRRIVERAAQAGLPFVGGHPMAGREAVGYEAADPDLFVDRPWVVCPPPADPATPARDAVARVEELARAVGARPVQMDPATHDAVVASISHLPLVVSAALVEAVAGDAAEWSSSAVLAAGGWASMSRLARGDAEMGAGILATNADEVAARLRRLRTVIDEWLADLDTADDARLRARLDSVRALLADS